MRLRLSRSRAGFTLIEALVAFVILALVMGGLLQGVGGGARNEAHADFLLRATRQAQSQYEALGVSEPIKAGETHGRYPDGLEWSLVVEPGRSVRSNTGFGATIGYATRLVVRRPNAQPGAADSLTLFSFKLVNVKGQPR